MSQRIRKVNELVHEEASKAILEFLGRADFITVKAVETTRDLKHAIIWVSIMGDEKEGFDRLKSKAHDIEKAVRSKMYSKYTPKLEFKIDHSEAYVENIAKLLRDEK